MRRQQAGLQVLESRHKLIAKTKPTQGTVYYIHFLNTLAQWYEALNRSKEFIKCHRLIIDQMQDHTSQCQSQCQECWYSHIGHTYYTLADYKMAAYFLEISTQKESQNVIEMGILLVELHYSYLNLGWYEEAGLTCHKLKELHSDIKAASLNKYFLRMHEIRDIIIPWYRNFGMEGEAIELEEQLIESVKEMEAFKILP